MVLEKVLLQVCENQKEDLIQVWNVFPFQQSLEILCLSFQQLPVLVGLDDLIKLLDGVDVAELPQHFVVDWARGVLFFQLETKRIDGQDGYFFGPIGEAELCD